MEKNWKKFADVIIHTVKIARKAKRGSPYSPLSLPFLLILFLHPFLSLSPLKLYFYSSTGHSSLLSQWEELESKAIRLKKQLNTPQSNFAFAFIEVRGRGRKDCYVVLRISVLQFERMRGRKREGIKGEKEKENERLKVSFSL